MPKKADRRRQKRRQQHQAGQDARRQEVRRAVDERIAASTETVDRLVAAAKDDTVPPSEVVGRLIEDLAGDDLLGRLLSAEEMVTPLAEEVTEDAGPERALTLAAALEGTLEGHDALATLAVSLAEEAGDLEVSGRIAERALTQLVAAEDGSVGGAGGDAARMAAEVVEIRLRQGRVGEAFEAVERWTSRWPEDADLNEAQAVVVARAAAVDDPDSEIFRILSLGEVDDDQRARAASTLARFQDRSLLYRLREAVEAFIEADPDLAAQRDEHIEEFLDDIREEAELGPLDQVEPELVGLAAERFWLHSEEDDEDPSGQGSVLGRFAAHPATAPELAAAARDWLRHVRYGLWLADWDRADGRRGLRLTDIVTRRQVLAFLPPEQLEGVARWTVLVGAVAPVAGIWRTGKVLLPLDPTLGDEAAEAVLFITERLFTELAREHGFKPPRPGPDRRGRAQAHGALSEVLDPMEPYEADITSKVIGSSLSRLVAMAEAERRRVPALQNTDGEELELMSATFPVAEPEVLRRRLMGDIDFEEGNSSSVTWLGRQMTAEEAANAVAQLRAQNFGEIVDPEGPQRWIRGVVHFERGGVRVEVNSRARLEAVSAKLRALGAGEPTVSRRIDPTMDLPWGGGRPRLGASSGAAADAAWAEQWVTEKVPALEGARPIEAARDRRRIVLLEKLLRQFEHDADVIAAGGGTPMDFEPLRERLGMRDGILELYFEG